MLDPKLLRETPEVVRAAIARKHLEVDLDAVLALDAAWRAQLQEVEALRGRRRPPTPPWRRCPRARRSFSPRSREMKAVSAAAKEKDTALKDTEEQWRQAMLTLPNLPHPSVPEGRTPEENVVFSTHGDVAGLSPHAVPHWEIGGFDRLFDSRGAKVTGAGFPFYVGDGARLVRALLQFFFDEDVRPVTRGGPADLGQRRQRDRHRPAPRQGGQDVPDRPGPPLPVPTAEMPLTNFFRDEILWMGSRCPSTAAPTPRVSGARRAATARMFAGSTASTSSTRSSC